MWSPICGIDGVSRGYVPAHPTYDAASSWNPGGQTTSFPKMSRTAVSIMPYWRVRIESGLSLSNGGRTRMRWPCRSPKSDFSSGGSIAAVSLTDSACLSRSTRTTPISATAWIPWVATSIEGIAVRSRRGPEACSERRYVEDARIKKLARSCQCGMKCCSRCAGCTFSSTLRSSFQVTICKAQKKRDRRRFLASSLGC